MTELDICSFLQKYDYDIRKTKNARWLDQKCTFDVLCIIADSIINYVEDTKKYEFTIRDIWDSDFAKNTIKEIFSKPDVDSKKAKNEYDKFFSQPIKLFAYSGLLSETKTGRVNLYKINDKNSYDILNYIALRETNALRFLNLYIEKVLTDSELYPYFENFFGNQNTQEFYYLKDTFTDFIIQNTNINTPRECGRIFTKVLNPLAFQFKKRGTKKGHLSQSIIIRNDLAYNKINWRDEYTKKDKNITRGEYNETLALNSNERAYNEYTITKAKRCVRKFNDKYYKGVSEVHEENNNIPYSATQIHHIFPASEFPEIATYLENLIALTPDQHYLKAHPNNRTRVVDKDFQYICLVSKCVKIQENLKMEQDKLYNFTDYKFVLNTGLRTDEFDYVEEGNFARILQVIDNYYS